MLDASSDIMVRFKLCVLESMYIVCRTKIADSTIAHNPRRQTFGPVSFHPKKLFLTEIRTNRIDDAIE